LIKFFASYSEYSDRDFYISGESYAGIYIPTLAQAIVDYNHSASKKINFKGFIVGNGCTDKYECGFVMDYDPFGFNAVASQAFFTNAQ